MVQAFNRLFSLLRGVVKCSSRTYKAALVENFARPAVITEIASDPVLDERERLGFELSGDVARVGQAVKKFKPGDRVVALKSVDVGAFATLCKADESETFAIAPSIDYKIACALPLAYGSAYLTFKEEPVEMNKSTVLVITSQGATGMAMVDMALNLFCCNVICASDTEAKCSTARAYGVKSTIEYKDENLAKLVAKVTKNANVDYVIDTVGMASAFHCLKHGGKYIILDAAAEKVQQVSLQQLVKNQTTIRGVWLGGYARENPAQFASMIEKVLKLREEEYINPSIGSIYPLDKVNEAFQCIANRQVVGKVLLSME